MRMDSLAAVVAFGETFVDLNWSSDGIITASLGGSCANVAAEISIMGGNASIITKVKDDCVGRFILRELSNYGVDTNMISIDRECDGVNAIDIINRLDNNVEYMLYNSNCIETMINRHEICFDNMKSYDIFHFGSNPIVSGTKPILDECIKHAKWLGLQISYDVNYRAGFWESLTEARQDIEQYVDIADYIKFNEYELGIYTGCFNDIGLNIEMIRNRFQNKVILITCAESGSYLVHQGKVEFFLPEDVISNDSVGAGDAYYAVFLRMLTQNEEGIEEYSKYASVANIVAANSVKYKGTIKAFCEGLSEYGLSLIGMR